MMPYTITTQRELRASFWRDNSQCSRRMIPDYSGIGRMHCTDTRVAFCDYLDSLGAGSINPSTRKHSMSLLILTLCIVSGYAIAQPVIRALHALGIL
jgi:hypothetical protein